MTNEKQTRKSTPTAEKSGANIMAGIGMIALIMAILWAVWRFGGLVFARITPDQATDRLGVCIIVAAIMHAYFTTTRRK
jgi:uncharacterized membrane protein YgcG